MMIFCGERETIGWTWLITSHIKLQLQMLMVSSKSDKSFSTNCEVARNVAGMLNRDQFLKDCKSQKRVGVVKDACNPSTWEEAGGLRVPCQPGLNSKILSKKKTKKPKERLFTKFRE
jgi:hypothetical protein